MSQIINNSSGEPILIDYTSEITSLLQSMSQIITQLTNISNNSSTMSQNIDAMTQSIDNMNQSIDALKDANLLMEDHQSKMASVISNLTTDVGDISVIRMAGPDYDPVFAEAVKDIVKDNNEEYF